MPGASTSARVAAPAESLSCPLEVEWSVAIFARNEHETVVACMEAVQAALAGTSGRITLVVNGSTDDTLERALAAASRFPALEIYRIAIADKANAWNQFVYRLRPHAALYFFVDAYALVEPGAFGRLARQLALNPEANAATAVPSCGRSAARLRRAMMRHGGLHGSLHVLRGSFLDRICARGIRLPFGFYRVDGLVCSLASHDLDPQNRRWQASRVAIAADVTWRQRQLSPWRWSDLRRQWNRVLQQTRGSIQWEVLKEEIHRHGYDSLPDDIDRAVLQRVASGQGRPGQGWSLRPLRRLTLRRMANRSPSPPVLFEPARCAPAGES